MADDRNFWGVVGDIASNTGNTLQHYQQSKLDARHKAHLDALAQRHAKEQYDAQMRGLDIREQQALAQQHAAEVRDSYNQSRLDQIGAQLQETERSHRADEVNAGIRESRIEANQTPDFVGLGRSTLQSATDRWRAGRAPRVVDSKDGSSVYGPDPNFNEPMPTWTTPGAGGGPSIIQSLRSNAEKYGQDPNDLEYQLTGKYPDAAGLLNRLGVTSVPRLNYAPSPGYNPGIQSPTRGVRWGGSFKIQVPAHILNDPAYAKLRAKGYTDEQIMERLNQ